jgi:hypothetical protein
MNNDCRIIEGSLVLGFNVIFHKTCNLSILVKEAINKNLIIS